MAYNGFLKDGSEVYIPNWPVDAALENLGSAGKYLGADALIQKSEINVPAVILAIASAEDPKQVTQLIKHFVCAARMDGDKITPANIEKLFGGNIYKLAEVFTLVVHAQYYDFFASGLAKENSQES